MMIYLIGVFVTFCFLTYMDWEIGVKQSMNNVGMNILMSLFSWVVPIGFIISYIIDVIKEEDCDL